MKQADFLKRINELERRVKDLEAQPKEQHTHFHTYPPVYQQPYVPYVSPAGPAPSPWKWTIGDPPGSPFGTSSVTFPLTAGKEIL
jgi:hypothetical protein